MLTDFRLGGWQTKKSKISPNFPWTIVFGLLISEVDVKHNIFILSITNRLKNTYELISHLTLHMLGLTCKGQTVNVGQGNNPCIFLVSYQYMQSARYKDN
jgi:hypothetical protein